MEKEDIVKYITENCEEPTVKQLAQHFGYSHSHFTREFKENFHTTPIDYISTMKIQKSIPAIYKKKKHIISSVIDWISEHRNVY